MVFKSLREFMDFLRSRGELKDCDKEVDRKIEIPKIIDKSVKTSGPAIFFKRVKGFHTPVVAGVFGTMDRIYLIIGANKYDAFKKLAKGLTNPIPSKLVADGPCKEVVKKGNDIDLNEIPVLWHHEKDSHHFITNAVCSGKDPDSGICNRSINRLAIQGKDWLTIQSNPPHQLGIIMNKYLEHGERCPIAIAIGTDPATFACSGCGVPYGMDEFDFTGGVLGEPIEIVKCETCNLEVPATSELIIEGEVRPGSEDGYVGKTEYANEAPFAEITGYFGKQTRSPIVHVTAITHRKNYIYHGLSVAEPISEHQVMNCFGMNLDFYTAAATVIPPESIIAINPLMGACGWGAVIAIKKRYPGQAKQVIYTLLAKASMKKVIIVDPDIDIFNPVEVEWAVSYRATAEDYVFTKEIPGINLDTTVTTPPNLMSKIGIDATLPLKGDKKGRVEVLCELGPAKYKDLDKIDLRCYIGER